MQKSEPGPIFPLSEFDTEQLTEIRTAVNGGFAFGNERFKAEIAAMLGRRIAPGISGRPKKDSDSAERRGAV